MNQYNDVYILDDEKYYPISIVIQSAAAVPVISGFDRQFVFKAFL